VVYLLTANHNEIDNKMTPFVSIVVVTKNEEGCIGACLASLIQLDYPRTQYEIIVIDGGSTDRTQHIVKEYHARLIIDTQGGLSHSRNIGIKSAKSEYIASIDADCLASKNWLKQLVGEVLSTDELTAAVGGPNLVMENDVPLAKVIGFMQETLMGSGGAPQAYKISTKRYVYGIPNCNVLYKKHILITEGCFDERYNMGEDAELNHRLTKAGYKYLYIPDAVVYHRRPSTLTKFASKMFAYGKGMARLTRDRKIFRSYSFIPSLAILSLILVYPVHIFVPNILNCYFGCLILYAIGLIVTTVHVCKRYDYKWGSLTLLLLPLQHLMYGLGFIKGILGGR